MTTGGQKVRRALFVERGLPAGGRSNSLYDPSLHKMLTSASFFLNPGGGRGGAESELEGTEERWFTGRRCEGGDVGDMEQKG